MTWQAVARKDFRDASRSKTVWLLTALFLLLFVGPAIAIPRFGEPLFTEFIDSSRGIVISVLPLVGIVLGYKSVIYERESGTLLLSLSLPHSRRDVAVGKFAGRSVVLTLPVLAGLLVAGIVVVALYDGVSILRYPSFILLTVLYGLAFLAIALAISMSTTSGRRVTAGAFGVYVVLVMFWTALVDLLVMVLYRFQPGEVPTPPDWALFLHMASPGEAYTHVLDTVFDLQYMGAHTALETPWYVNSWVAMVILLAWVVVPFAFGYLRFEKSEL